ncbi:hypothetical protein M407DRAFT_13176 [Tulasnella calospora MUT 4182]|uniref:Uncharacterized protein n=1 Tax=Tulasnella calospora MUT 4182 TaxID=1051891 RepID=A0A0C3L1U9_9AGAM|nr:hypothetical protein M407DRAFT_13176 [Tulasnella calospora MUT 4182]
MHLSALTSDFVTAGSSAVSKYGVRLSSWLWRGGGTTFLPVPRRERGRGTWLRAGRGPNEGKRFLKSERRGRRGRSDNLHQHYIEGVKGEVVEQESIADEGSPGPLSTTLLAVQEPREEKEPSPPTEQPQTLKLSEQPMRLPTGPPPTLKPATELAAPLAKPTQMKKPRSVSGSTSGRPPSTGARKAAPLSEKPVNVVGARGGISVVFRNRRNQTNIKSPQGPSSGMLFHLEVTGFLTWTLLRQNSGVPVLRLGRDVAYLSTVEFACGVGRAICVAKGWRSGLKKSGSIVSNVPVDERSQGTNGNEPVHRCSLLGNRVAFVEMLISSPLRK